MAWARRGNPARQWLLRAAFGDRSFVGGCCVAERRGDGPEARSPAGFGLWPWASWLPLARVGYGTGSGRATATDAWSCGIGGLVQRWAGLCRTRGRRPRGATTFLRWTVGSVVVCVRLIWCLVPRSDARYRLGSLTWCGRPWHCGTWSNCKDAGVAALGAEGGGHRPDDGGLATLLVVCR